MRYTCACAYYYDRPLLKDMHLWRTMLYNYCRFYFLRAGFFVAVTQVSLNSTDVSQISYLEDAPKDLMLNRNGRSVITIRSIYSMCSITLHAASAGCYCCIYLHVHVYQRCTQCIQDFGSGGKASRGVCF